MLFKNLHFEQYDAEVNSKSSFFRYDVIWVNERNIKGLFHRTSKSNIWAQ